MISGALLFITAVCLGSVSQVLLKKSAITAKPGFVKEYLNATVLFAYFLLLMSFVLTVAAYRTVEFRFTPVFDSLSYIIVPALGAAFFGERLKTGQMWGLFLIIIGIIIFNIR